MQKQLGAVQAATRRHRWHRANSSRLPAACAHPGVCKSPSPSCSACAPPTAAQLLGRFAPPLGVRPTAALAESPPKASLTAHSITFSHTLLPLTSQCEDLYRLESRGRAACIVPTFEPGSQLQQERPPLHTARPSAQDAHKSVKFSSAAEWCSTLHGIQPEFILLILFATRCKDQVLALARFKGWTTWVSVTMAGYSLSSNDFLV